MSKRAAHLGLWVAVFGMLFVLSIDVWSWHRQIRLTLFGLPSWTFYFVFLQLILALAVGLFGAKYWTGAGDGDEADR